MADDEQLDVLDASGAAIGVKSRAQVHADDDWHGLVFVWSAWVEDGKRWMLLQRRGGRPDHPFDTQVDALAGGHTAAGETPLSGACRELHEEVGLRLKPDDLIELGTMRMDRPGSECRRVIESLLLYPEPLELAQLKCSDEVDGFALVDLDDFTDLIHGRRDEIKALLRYNSEPDRVGELRNSAIAAYPDEILESFRRSLRAIDHYLRVGEVDPGLISS